MGHTSQFAYCCLSRSSISSKNFIIFFRPSLVFLANMRPSEVQYVCILCSYFSFDNVFIRLVLNCVRLSATKIPSSFCLSSLLFEYTWFLTRYDRNQTITCDFPSFTFLITWLRPMSFIDNSIPSLSLHIFITRSSVFTGWIWSWLSTGTRTLWNLRLVRREYCSWLSILNSSSAMFLYKDSNSASCSWIVFSFCFTCLSSQSSQIYCLHIFSLFESMVFVGYQ